MNHHIVILHISKLTKALTNLAESIAGLFNQITMVDKVLELIFLEPFFGYVKGLAKDCIVLILMYRHLLNINTKCALEQPFHFFKFRFLSIPSAILVCTDLFTNVHNSVIVSQSKTRNHTIHILKEKGI